MTAQDLERVHDDMQQLHALLSTDRALLAAGGHVLPLVIFPSLYHRAHVSLNHKKLLGILEQLFTITDECTSSSPMSDLSGLVEPTVLAFTDGAGVFRTLITSFANLARASSSLVHPPAFEVVRELCGDAQRVLGSADEKRGLERVREGLERGGLVFFSSPVLVKGYSRYCHTEVQGIAPLLSRVHSSSTPSIPDLATLHCSLLLGDKR